MKKELIIAVISYLYSIPLPGNCLGNRLLVVDNSFQEVVDSNKVSASTIQDAKSDQINEALHICVNKLKIENAQLLCEIETLKKDTAELSKRNGTHVTVIYNLNKKVEELDKSVIQYRSKYEQLVNDISRLDAVIYKQCLLYPLEGKYDSLLVNESLKSIESFSSINKNLSKEFEEYRDIYEPLLKSYKQYNAQLFSFIESKVKHIRATGGVVYDAHKTKFENELKQLPYYSEYYENRNKPPYKSILYLDNLIDKFLIILNKKGNVENDILELLNSF